MNLDKIRAKLAAVNSVNTARNALWKPTGKHIIRILPYIHNTENPFVEMYFHYNFGKDKKTYLSPTTYGKSDPIVELANKLKKSGDKEQYKQGKALDPKMRVYVPILVRGEESDGPKFWAFGKTVYQELLAICNDPDYGDISDLKTGYDISVEFISASDAGKDFPDTTVRAKPKQTPAFDANNKELLAKYKAMKKLSDIYPEPTYDELEKALERWLSPEADEHGVVEGDEDTTKPTEPVVSETPTTVSTKKINKESATKDFDSLFGT